MSQDQGQISATLEKLQLDRQGPARPRTKSIGFREPGRRKSTIADLTNLSDSDSDEDEEFFDAVDAGEVEVVDVMPLSPPPFAKGETTDQKPSMDRDLREDKLADIKTSFKGYEDPIRKRFKLEADNRPKISLWVNTSETVTLSTTDSLQGHPQIHDWKGHDQNDSTRIL